LLVSFLYDDVESQLVLVLFSPEAEAGSRFVSVCSRDLKEGEVGSSGVW
jgi:hypothetical protein